ncbi:hypothetical protein CEXT_580201 [Caerostris extrusa]|uniref:Uncharacterized protein n=1 Tax=Caerostris extrusa TaxID=172846 RepID=A0AAV4RDT1_CAEEX|nr:hypothetical protein CEXT_580201 [Caerostris extrusa]
MRPRNLIATLLALVKQAAASKVEERKLEFSELAVDIVDDLQEDHLHTELAISQHEWCVIDSIVGAAFVMVGRSACKNMSYPC